MVFMDFCFDISKHSGWIYILREIIALTRLIARTWLFTECIEPGIGCPGREMCGSENQVQYQCLETATGILKI
jgi:hypothetical protein